MYQKWTVYIFFQSECNHKTSLFILWKKSSSGSNSKMLNSNWPQLTSLLALRNNSIRTSCSLAFNLSAAMLELLLSMSTGDDDGDSVGGLGGVTVRDGCVTVAVVWLLPPIAVSGLAYVSFTTGLTSGGVANFGLFWADKLTSKLWNEVGGKDPATV